MRFYCILLLHYFCIMSSSDNNNNNNEVKRKIIRTVNSVLILCRLPLYAHSYEQFFLGRGFFVFFLTEASSF